MDHEGKSILDWPGDRVGAVGSRNAAQVRAAGFRSQVVPTRPPVHVGQGSKEGDEGWGGLNPGGVSDSTRVCFLYWIVHISNTVSQ